MKGWKQDRKLYFIFNIKLANWFSSCSFIFNIKLISSLLNLHFIYLTLNRMAEKKSIEGRQGALFASPGNQ